LFHAHALITLQLVVVLQLHPPFMPTEIFTIEFELHGHPVVLDAQLEQTAYNYRMLVRIGGRDIIFEPDEERNWRAIVPETALSQLKASDRELIIATAAWLEQLRS